MSRQISTTSIFIFILVAALLQLLYITSTLDLVSPNNGIDAAISTFAITNTKYTTSTVSTHIDSKIESQTALNSVHEYPDKPRQHRFAYAFLLAGASPQDLFSTGGFYGVLVANEYFKRINSIADVILMIRMHKDSNATSLTQKQEELLLKAGIQIEYLPGPPLVDTFMTATFDKFRILSLTEYDRVIFLDSDEQPFCNIDYLFTQSIGTNAILEPNVVKMGKLEPANAGLFMLEPNQEDAEHLRNIINDRYPYGSEWDTDIGWQKIQPPDHWQSWIGQNDTTKWKFYCGDADQGLLYYWTKYVKRSVTILHPRKMEHYRCTEEAKESKPFDYNSTCHQFDNYDQISDRKRFVEFDAFHYTGHKKPWLQDVKKYNRTIIPENSSGKEFHDKSCKVISYDDRVQVWFNLLSSAMYRLGMNDIDTKTLFPLPRRQSLGGWSTAEEKDAAKEHFHPKWERKISIE